MVSKLIYRNLTASNMLATTSVLIALLNRDIKHAQWMNGRLGVHLYNYTTSVMLIVRLYMCYVYNVVLMKK